MTGRNGRRNMPQKIFLDTNVWFSALWGSRNCRTLLDAHAEGKINAVLSQEVLKELLRNLKIKIPRAFDVFQNMMLLHPPEIIEDPKIIPQHMKLLIHQKDQGIFVAAIAAKVKFFVTGNTKDFKVEKLEKLTGIKILTPKQAVRKILGSVHLRGW